MAYPHSDQHKLVASLTSNAACVTFEAYAGLPRIACILEVDRPYSAIIYLAQEDNIARVMVTLGVENRMICRQIETKGNAATGTNATGLRNSVCLQFRSRTDDTEYCSEYHYKFDVWVGETTACLRRIKPDDLYYPEAIYRPSVVSQR